MTTARLLVFILICAGASCAGAGVASLTNHHNTAAFVLGIAGAVCGVSAISTSLIANGSRRALND